MCRFCLADAAPCADARRRAAAADSALHAGEPTAAEEVSPPPVGFLIHPREVFLGLGLGFYCSCSIRDRNLISFISFYFLSVDLSKTNPKNLDLQLDRRMIPMLSYVLLCFWTRITSSVRIEYWGTSSRYNIK